MNLLPSELELGQLLLFLAQLVAVVAILWGASWILLRRSSLGSEGRFPRQLLMVSLSGMAIVYLILVAPVAEATRGQLLQLFGYLLTAMIALSSTTFVSNAMAGLMLRAVRNFKPGEFVRVGDQFGRVSERGLFHTEIQIENRNLTTLPNLYLISQPVEVVRSSGTIVSATVSLGYDLPRTKVEDRLLHAATETGLEEPFVRVLELGDFSVTYRISGMLTDVKRILTARSGLRKQILDSLHDAGMEIMSPNFMVQRRPDGDDRMIPEASYERWRPSEGEPIEERVFDKAERAETLEHLAEEKERLTLERKSYEEERKAATDEARRTQLERAISYVDVRLENIAAKVARVEKEVEGD